MDFSYPLGSLFRDVIDWFWVQKGREEVESFVTLCWQIWMARNEAIFNSIFDPPSLCVEKSLDWLGEYRKVLLYGMGNSPSSRPKVSWCRPPSGVIKINVDGAFSLNNDKHRIGFIAQDSLGKFFMASSRTSWSESSADLVEAKAILWALSMARDFNRKHRG